MSIHHVEADTRYGKCFLTESEIEIKIPGITQEFTFVHISDLHFAVSEDGDSSEEKKRAEESEKAWRDNGNFRCNPGQADEYMLFPAEANEIVAQRIREISPDCVFITGDGMNYVSEANLRRLQRFMDSLGCDCIFVPGNHDKCDDMGPATKEIYMRLTASSPDFRVVSMGGFDIIAIDDSDVNITEEQLKLTKAQIETGRPFLLLLHVPVLANAAKDAVWQIWGDNWMIGEDQQSETNRSFLRLLSENSDIVRAVFSGHVHISTGDDENHGHSVRQYTAAPSFSGFLRIIHACGTK